MKKLLFLSNSSKPTEEQYTYVGEEKLTNFSIPIVTVCEKIGIHVTIGLNRKYAPKITCEYPVDFYNAEIYRNPFNLKEVWRAFKNACNELKKGDYVGIHCNTPIGGLVGRLAGKRCGISKVIYTAHGFHFYKGAPMLNWLLYYPVEKWLARYTDAMITINQEDYSLARRKMKLRNGGKVYYVPGVGIDTSQYKFDVDLRIRKRAELELNDEDIALISMGDLIERKNYSVAIQAVSEAKNEKLHYFICGEGSEESHLRGLAEQLNVTRQIHFLGFRADIKELLIASDVFVFTTKQEGLPRSLMEAMASGLPCVASKIRGNTDLLENTEGGFLCNPYDASEFAEKLNLLATNTALRETMGKNNLIAVQKFSEETVIKEMQNIYAAELMSN